MNRKVILALPKLLKALFFKKSPYTSKNERKLSHPRWSFFSPHFEEALETKTERFCCF